MKQFQCLWTASVPNFTNSLILKLKSNTKRALKINLNTDVKASLLKNLKIMTWTFFVKSSFLGVLLKEYPSYLTTAAAAAAAAAKSLLSYLTPCDPIDGSPPGSPIPGILQARILEWIAISFSNAWKWKVKVKSLSRVQLLATPESAAYQAPPSMRFFRQEYWSGVPLPSPTLLLRALKFPGKWEICYCNI